ncbi:conserved hypothetical protein [Altererythrobacter sp. B11]|uniref:nucleotidyltransferase family protein n=1 Tax=Altererythrobacter sp. B11 TaxID=2060312 RepID=UPI000DC6E9F0|nr:nucleotidyltransferase family protein [Altererythrobacter sp. B11]BBC72200.1 conserved hypothetical protein [Altererythrobacter sp. B11]
MAELPCVALLAAGTATRFGGGKLDAPCAGKPLGQWALDRVAEAGLPPGLIVTGPEAPRFVASAEGWELIVNPQPARGLGTSVALAAQAAIRRRAPALLVLLADMPLVPAELLRRLASTAPPAAVSHGGRPGVPALFGAELLPRLAALSSDRGAGELLAGLASTTLIPPPGALLDVDTQDDLAEAEAALRAG